MLPINIFWELQWNVLLRDTSHRDSEVQKHHSKIILSLFHRARRDIEEQTLAGFLLIYFISLNGKVLGKCVGKDSRYTVLILNTLVTAKSFLLHEGVHHCLGIQLTQVSVGLPGTHKHNGLTCDVGHWDGGSNLQTKQECKDERRQQKYKAAKKPKEHLSLYFLLFLQVSTLH